jgi:hypothetical protein
MFAREETPYKRMCVRKRERERERSFIDNQEVSVGPQAQGPVEDVL